MGKQSFREYIEEKTNSILQNPTDVESYRSAILNKLFGENKHIIYAYGNEFIQEAKTSKSEFLKTFAVSLESLFASDNIEDLGVAYQTLSKLAQINELNWGEYFVTLITKQEQIEKFRTDIKNKLFGKYVDEVNAYTKYLINNVSSHYEEFFNRVDIILNSNDINLLNKTYLDLVKEGKETGIDWGGFFDNIFFSYPVHDYMTDPEFSDGK